MVGIKIKTLNQTMFSSSQATVVMMGTPSSFQFWINSGSPSIFTCSMSLFKFSSVVPVYTQRTKNVLGLFLFSFSFNKWVIYKVTEFFDCLSVYSMTPRQNTAEQNRETGEGWCTVEAEDVEQHSSDLVIFTVWV